MPEEAVTAEGILSYIDKNGSFNSEDYAKSIQEDHQKIVGIIKSLQGLGEVVSVEQVTRKHWELTDEGRDVARSGSHEAKVFNAVPPEGITQSELMSTVPNAKIGFSKAVSCGWVRVDKSPSGPRVCRRVQSVTDVVRLHLAALQDSPDADVSEKLKAEYRKRKLLQEVVSKSYTVSKGSEFTLNIEKPETDLTPEMIASGSWRSKTFKPYNFSALGVPPARGHLHPLLKVRAEFRQIFLEMGFSEMPTNRYVESSFWNFDALFQPQQHPARDAHDTFFISDPANSVSLPADYLPKVKKVHSEGGFGSQGYGYDWKLEEAQKNLLRTHTTAVSARMLRQLAQEKEFRPVKYFSIDRVFRNETLDATHLAEFHQVEGLVADRGLTLGHLMGVINEFFKKLGIEQIRFKPAYNPYTEPSMEIFSWHAGLGKWVEIGNSGMFRPEMLLPMGLPEDVSVIAWGLSLERPTMIKYKLDNIRDLCGHRVDLQMVATNPICRLDKQSGAARPDPALVRLERRQQAVLDELAGLGLMLDEVRQRRGLKPLSSAAAPTATAAGTLERLRVAVYAAPDRPPLSIGLLCRMLAMHAPVWCSTHLHSSCPAAPAAAAAAAAGRLLPPQNGGSPATAALHLTLIWRPGSRVETVVSPLSAPRLHGEAVAARLLARLLHPWRPRLYAESPEVDAWLDQAEELAAAGGDRKLRAALVAAAVSAIGGRSWLCGNEATLADVVVWSVLTQLEAVSPPLKRWADAVAALA